MGWEASIVCLALAASLDRELVLDGEKGCFEPFLYFQMLIIVDQGGIESAVGNFQNCACNLTVGINLTAIIF